MIDKNWPAWFNGPDGESQVFNSADEVPAGWTSGAEKRTATGKPPAPAPAPSPSPTPTPSPAAGGPKGEELDAEGWPFDPAMHAATRSRTKANLWRMKVGVNRPAAKPGFPKPVLDL